MPVASKNSADVIQGCPQKRRPSQFIVTAHLLSRSLASLCAALQFCSSAEQRLSFRRQARKGGECAECSGIADILGPVQSMARACRVLPPFCACISYHENGTSECMSLSRESISVKARLQLHHGWQCPKLSLTNSFCFTRNFQRFYR